MKGSSTQASVILHSFVVAVAMVVAVLIHAGIMKMD